MKGFGQFIRQGDKLIPKGMGQCFPYATKKAGELMNSGQEVFVVHGTITQPFSLPPETNQHAWVESENMVYDFQCMEGGGGGKFSGKGYPKDVFYELFQPKVKARYTAEEALKNTIQTRHAGPW